MTTPDSPSRSLNIDVLLQVRSTILVTDRIGTILQAHGGGGRPLGYAPEQLEGRSGLEFIAAQDHQIMADMYVGVGNLPIVAKPEPFPLHIVGPDGITRAWDCMPGGFVTDEVDGWIVTLICRKDQNPSIAALDCFISGGSSIDIAKAVASRYHENNHDGWRKSALVIHRTTRRDGELSPWRTLVPPTGTDRALMPALESCLTDPSALWNLVVPGNSGADCDLPQPLRQAAAAAGLPYCTLLACGIGDHIQIAFIRLSNFEYQLQGNNKLADQAINTVLVQALNAERSRLLLDRAMRSDPLTGISNRLHFEEVINETSSAIDHAALFVDVDDFKTVNDTFGHGVGDSALREVAARIVRSCRPHDLVARIGGDEFGIILRDVSDDEARQIADQIRNSMSTRFDLDQGPASISVTVGIALPTKDATLTELVRRADHAMLADKAMSRNRV